MKKLTKKQLEIITTSIIAILAALGLTISCTNSLVFIKGHGNRIKEENKINVDSTSTSINIKE